MQRHTDDSYLLRFWRDHDGAPLRATLTPVGHPEAPRHFAHLDDLLSFLSEQAYARAGPGRAGLRPPADSDYGDCTPDAGG